jgi:hypothetical protein
MTDYRIYDYPENQRAAAAKLIAAHDSLYLKTLVNFNKAQQAAQTRRRTVIGLAFGIAIAATLALVL